ncbi:MAG: hypothetical protein HY687_02470 [Chloroflexi bacterium]|nr:hypothetical protein [Chloroflexota bacterium]
MATAEELWTQIVRTHLPIGPAATLTKAQQQALAVALQEWSSLCIRACLEEIVQAQRRNDLYRQIGKVQWQINYRGKDFLGAVRVQEVDVWLTNPEAGLVLAVDPKHFQSSDSLKKNWQNGLNDLIAFATNIHERFPLCAVGGIISFPEWATSPQSLKQMHSICARAIPRTRALNAYGKFEGFALAIYDTSHKLVWPFSPDSLLKPDATFAALADALYSRTIALL